VKDLIETYFPKADYIQLVLDNLNTHFEGSLIETLGKIYPLITGLTGSLNDWACTAGLSPPPFSKGE